MPHLTDSGGPVFPQEPDEGPYEVTFLEDYSELLQRGGNARYDHNRAEVDFIEMLTKFRMAAENSYAHRDTPQNLREELEEMAVAADVILAYIDRPKYAEFGNPYWPGWAGLVREVEP